MNNELIFIVGPTAIGKSSFAINLAKEINGTIINADSMQVYSNLRIITARPSKKDQNIIEHKLYGYIDGSERYNVAKWCNDISEIIAINKKKSIPSIIVGGTGMYIEKLINGLIDLPQIPEKIKKNSLSLLKEVGTNEFIKIIKKFDHKSLNNISLNDQIRLRRIWEVYYHTGITFSKWSQNENIKFLVDYKYKIYLFNPPREKIYQNVDCRFNSMMNEGALDEVRSLLNLKIDKSLPIMRAHGVPEISDYFENKITLDECILKGQQVTRNYVKRQLTWWRSSTLPIHRIFNDFPNKINNNSIN